MNLALGNVEWCPLAAESFRDLKSDIITELDAAGWQLERRVDDREDVSVGYRVNFTWYAESGATQKSDSVVSLRAVLVQVFVCLGCLHLTSKKIAIGSANGPSRQLGRAPGF